MPDVQRQLDNEIAAAHTHLLRAQAAIQQHRDQLRALQATEDQITLLLLDLIDDGNCHDIDGVRICRVGESITQEIHGA